VATLYLDTETYSDTDLKEVGTYRYAETAEVMLLTYAIDDGPVHCVDFTVPVTQRIMTSTEVQLRNRDFNAFDVVIAHNAMFDRNVLRLGDLKIDIPIEQWRCTMVQALQHALPGSLSELGDVLGLPEDQRKLAEGKKLIQRFCKPAPKNHKVRRYTRETHPEEWERFKQYAIQDVATMREIHRRLPTWNWKPDDVAMWHLDQRINDRGFKVDVELAEAGARAAETEKAFLEARFRELTGLAPTQRAKVQEFINANYGLELDATAKHIMQPIADDDSLPAELREIARIMLSANKSSTAKYGRMTQVVSSDGRFRGGLQFSGARRTRRWAGRDYQPQNLPSRGLPKTAQVDAYIAALKAGVHDALFDDLMLYGAAALRGVVIA
jgi:DNA polymerase